MADINKLGQFQKTAVLEYLYDSSVEFLVDNLLDLMPQAMLNVIASSLTRGTEDANS